MLMNIFAGVYLLLSGALAGVLVAVDIAIVPLLDALPGHRFVQAHQLLDPRFDPVMPRANKIALVVGVALLIFGSGGLPAKVAYGFAELCVAGVGLVSELTNVRINRCIDTWDTTDLPGDWRTTRARWFRANRVRTVLGMAGFAAAIAGVIAV